MRPCHTTHPKTVIERKKFMNRLRPIEIRCTSKERRLSAAYFYAIGKDYATG